MAGLNGFGVVFETSSDGGTTYTPIQNAYSVSGPEIERSTVDVTAHDSPGGWQEFVGGLKNAGEVSVSVNYDPVAHDKLVALFDSDTPVECRLRWPDDIAHMTFRALLTNYPPEAPHDDKMTLETTWKVAGKPSFVEGAPTTTTA